MQHLCQGLGRLDPDPEPGEQSRTDADGDPPDLLELEVAPDQQLLERGGHRLLPRLAGDRHPAHDLVLRADRNAGLRRRGLDPHDDHWPLLQGARATSSSGQRSAHAAPTDDTVILRISDRPAGS